MKWYAPAPAMTPANIGNTTLDIALKKFGLYSRRKPLLLTGRYLNKCHAPMDEITTANSLIEIKKWFPHLELLAIKYHIPTRRVETSFFLNEESC
jgi:hypothetical protein